MEYDFKYTKFDQEYLEYKRKGWSYMVIIVALLILLIVL